LSLCQELEDVRGIAWSLEVFAGLQAARGRPEPAARLWGASDKLLESVAGSLSATHAWIRERYIDGVKTALGEARFEAVCADGRAMSLAQAVSLARLPAARPS
jgi:hypothetical protein